MQAISKYDAFQKIISSNLAAPILFVLMLGLTIYVIYYYYSATINLNITSNFAPRIQECSNIAETNYNNDYISKRKSLSNLLQTYQINNPYLINFYVLTANMAGLFTPAADGVYDITALKYALRAGARGFVFDIYSGTKEQNYAPVLHVLQPGSSWKIQTMNEMPLALALQTLRTEGFENSSLASYNDPMIIYFRFRGTIISTTLNLSAAALRSTLEDKRVSTSSNESIPALPINNFMNKFVLFSNMNNTKTSFDDYNNNKPGDGVINSYSPNNILNMNIASNEAITITNNTKLVYSMCSPKPDDSQSNDNMWNIEDAEKVGINMFGFNFFSYDNGLSTYLSDDAKYGIYSFYLKPDSLLYKPVMTSPPLKNNVNVGNGIPVVK